MIEYQNLIQMSTLTNETYYVDPFKEKSYILDPGFTRRGP